MTIESRTAIETSAETCSADVVTYPSLAGAECPWPSLTRLWEHHPLYRLPDHPDMYVVSRWEDIRYVSSRRDIFTSDRGRSALLGTETDVMIGASTLVVTESDGDDHRRKRAIAFQAVKPGRLVEYEPMIASSTGSSNVARPNSSRPSPGHCRRT
jgi:cytochrome P450